MPPSASAYAPMPSSAGEQDDHRRLAAPRENSGSSFIPPGPVSVVERPPERRRGDHDLVAGLQPYPRVAGAADPGGRPGRDDVAGLQRHPPRQMGDQLGHGEDQVRGRRLLHRFAVQLELELDAVVRPRLVGGDQRRSARRRPVEDLARHPLGCRELEVARREVVQQRVAGDVLEGVARLDLAAPAPDHHRDLRLVVDLGAGRGQRDLHAVSGEGVPELGEDRGNAGWVDPGLGGVGAVVEADADDLVRVGNAAARGPPRAPGRGLPPSRAASASSPSRPSSRTAPGPSWLRARAALPRPERPHPFSPRRGRLPRSVRQDSHRAADPIVAARFRRS